MARAHMRGPVALAALLLCGFDLLHRPDPEVERGNGDYRARRFAEAEQRYRRAKKEMPGSAETRYDLGTALLAQDRNDEAAEELREAIKMGAGPRAHYNLGTAHLRAGRADEAIDSYRRALRADPADANAKWNLELALRMKQEKQKEQQEQSQPQQSQEPQEPDSPKEQDQNESSPEQQHQQEEEQQQPSQDQANGPQDPEANPPARPETPGDAEQADEAILDALEREEKNLQAERLRTLYRRRRVPRDW